MNKLQTKNSIKGLRCVFKYGVIDMIDWFEIIEGSGYTIIKSGLKHTDGEILSPFNLYISVVQKTNSKKKALEVFNNWWKTLTSNKEGNYFRLKFNQNQKENKFYVTK